MEFEELLKELEKFVHRVHQSRCVRKTTNGIWGKSDELLDELEKLLKQNESNSK